MPRKQGRDEIGSSVSHSTTPPPRGSHEHTIALGFGLAVNGSLAPPPKRTKMATSALLRERAMTAEELEETLEGSLGIAETPAEGCFCSYRSFARAARNTKD